MKNIIYFSLCLLFISCSSSKNIELQVVNDFIKEESDLKHYYTVMIKEASPRIIPLEYYEQAFQDKDIPLETHKVRIEPFGKRPYIWPVDTVEINSLKERYKKDTVTYQWTRKDFIKTRLKIFKEKEIRNTNSVAYKKYAVGNALELSKPIVTSNNKFAFFFYSSYIVGLRYGENSRAILMENVNGRWKTIGMYAPPYY